VDNAAAFFPIRADFVGVFWNFQAIADGERRAGLFDYFFGFIERIDGKRDDLGIFLLEFVDMGLEVGYLPNAVGSPNSPIKDDDRIFACEVVWDIEQTGIDGLHHITRKWVAGT
jgi:hypothetical protein